MNTQINQTINYRHNGNIYTGKVMSIKANEIVVIDTNDNASMELYNAGHAVGTCITESQIVKYGKVR